MKIASSQVDMSARHSAASAVAVAEHLRMWTGPRPDSAPAAPRAVVPPGVTQVSISDAGRAQQAGEVHGEDTTDPKLLLLRSIIERLMGRKIHWIDTSTLQTSDTESPAAAAPGGAAPGGAAAGAPAQPQFGLEYDRITSTSETESTTFQAAGVVRTADGQEIRFEISLAMSRSYQSTTEEHLRLGNAQVKDPLVINFAGTAAQLSDTSFRLDLDGNGTTDNVRAPAAGSGFLVFDRNGNGKVDDRSELFGPATGNGFSELAALDSDGNGWIDSGDAAFSKLRAWVAGGTAGGRLESLASHDVGALAVASVATPFALKDAGNQTLGQVRATSVYLTESGTAGTVQQVDIAV